MKLIAALTALSSIVNVALAAPVSSPIAVDTSTCSTASYVVFVKYTLYIGAPYNENLCNTAHASIREEDVAVTHWHCVDDGHGHTKLWFNAPLWPGMPSKVERGLDVVYGPRFNFNCLDHASDST